MTFRSTCRRSGSRWLRHPATASSCLAVRTFTSGLSRSPGGGRRRFLCPRLAAAQGLSLTFLELFRVFPFSPQEWHYRPQRNPHFHSYRAHLWTRAGSSRPEGWHRAGDIRERRRALASMSCKGPSVDRSCDTSGRSGFASGPSGPVTEHCDELPRRTDLLLCLIGTPEGVRRRFLCPGAAARQELFGNFSVVFSILGVSSTERCRSPQDYPQNCRSGGYSCGFTPPVGRAARRRPRTPPPPRAAGARCRAGRPAGGRPAGRPRWCRPAPRSPGSR